MATSRLQIGDYQHPVKQKKPTSHVDVKMENGKRNVKPKLINQENPKPTNPQTKKHGKTQTSKPGDQQPTEENKINSKKRQ